MFEKNKLIADMQSYQNKSGSMNTENRISKEINIRQTVANRPSYQIWFHASRRPHWKRNQHFATVFCYETPLNREKTNPQTSPDSQGCNVLVTSNLCGTRLMYHYLHTSN